MEFYPKWKPFTSTIGVFHQVTNPRVRTPLYMNLRSGKEQQSGKGRYIGARPISWRTVKYKGVISLFSKLS